jgi:hypothetical protein
MFPVPTVAGGKSGSISEPRFYYPTPISINSYSAIALLNPGSGDEPIVMKL